MHSSFCQKNKKACICALGWENTVRKYQIQAFLCFWKDSLKKTFKFAEVLCAAGWKVLNRPVTSLCHPERQRRIFITVSCKDCDPGNDTM